MHLLLRGRVCRMLVPIWTIRNIHRTTLNEKGQRIMLHLRRTGYLWDCLIFSEFQLISAQLEFERLLKRRYLQQIARLQRKKVLHSSSEAEREHYVQTRSRCPLIAGY